MKTRKPKNIGELVNKMKIFSKLGWNTKNLLKSIEEY